MSPRVEVIGEATMYLGDCLDIVPTLGRVSHIFIDPPYEESLHAAKNSQVGRKMRNDGVAELKGLDFASIDSIRERVVALGEAVCDGWFIAFCTVEGVAKWADAINASRLKYKRACVWVKPDSTPQLNGQGPAQGAECFVTAWGGAGHAKWNSGGKRGVYTHCVNVGRHGGHPTEKPVSLMSELIRDFSRPNDLILDCFAGSGTTGVAAVNLGRRFVGVEMNPTYFDLACRRLEAAHKQPRLFAEPIAKPVQTSMFGGEAA